MEVLTLHTASARAEILPGFGFNCYSLELATGKASAEVLWSADGFPSGGGRPSGSGIPILFPFPGRIQGTVLQWQGQAYSLPEGDGLGNAIHGFVHERPWRVLDRTGNRAAAQFQASVDDPLLLECWPADFRITATYTLGDRALDASFVVENPGDRPLPFGLGLHPYFRLPLGGDATPDTCRVRIPVGRRWELDGMLTTGRSRPLTDDEPRPDRGAAFGDLTLDHVYGDLAFAGHECHATIDDPGAERRLTLSWGSAFRYCVAYTPPHRRAICIEPYTCAPDPFRLTALGVDAGLEVLAPGGTFAARMRIALDASRRD